MLHKTKTVCLSTAFVVGCLAITYLLFVASVTPFPR